MDYSKRALEIMEIDALQWEIREVNRQIEEHDKIQQELKARREEILEKIKIVEERYGGADEGDSSRDNQTEN